MKEADLQNLMEKGQVEKVTPQQTKPAVAPQETLAEFTPFLELLRYNKRARTTAPTKTPAGILKHFEFYDDGVNRRLYVYVNGTWRYVTLT